MALAANSIEGKAENYLRRIENLHDDLDSKGLLHGRVQGDPRGYSRDLC